MPLKLVPPRIGKTTFWSVRGTYLGIYVDRSTKATSRAAATKFLAKWKGEIERGQFAQPGELTFFDAALSYLDDHGEDRFLQPIVDRIGYKLVRSIAQKDIDDLAIALYPHATQATRNRQVHTPVSAVLKHAGVDQKLRRPKGWRGKQRTQWLWPEQAFRVFDAADKIDPEFGLFLRTLCYTGLRLGEALNLRCDDLQLDEAYAVVHDTKNGTPRGIYLTQALADALSGHPRGVGRKGQRVFRFTKCGRLYTLLRAVKRVVGPGLSFLTFHTFRHTWATWMRRYGGLDRDGLVATGAWKDATSAARYSHVVVTEESRKADLLPVENAWKKTADTPK